MPKTLLLADDSVTIQKVVGLSFASEDIVLVTVNNGDDAIARARDARPDVVLADVVMPGKNGYEVCEAIKADPALRHVPVLLLTGTFEAFDQERARRAGADGHVTKPFEAQALVQQVKALMARSVAAPAAAEPATTPTPPAHDLADDTPVPMPEPEPQPVAEAPAFFDEAGEASALGFDRAGEASALGFDQAGEAASLGFDEAGEPSSLGFDEVGIESPLAPPLAPPPLDLDEALAEGELELATVAEDDSTGLSGASPAPTAVSFGGSASQESFRGSPVFGPDFGNEDASDPDLLSPRAVAPEPADLLPAPGDDEGDDLGFAASTSLHAALAAPMPVGFFEDESDPEGETVLDPGVATGYDLDFDDLDDPLASARGEAVVELPPTESKAPSGPPTFTEPVEAVEAVAAEDEPPGAEAFASDAPEIAPATPTPHLRDVPTPHLRDVPPPSPAVSASVEPEPVEEALFEDAEDAIFGPASAAPPWTPPATGFATEPGWTPEPRGTPSQEAAPASAAAVAPPARDTAPAGTAAPTVDLGPILRERIHETLEKVAWEAFSDLSDTIVRQVVERVEAVAWEVIPQLAEALVREEIRRMTGEGEDSDPR